jgi:outer membrane protein OmpA-like peptidoglycan-associated protein
MFDDEFAGLNFWPAFADFMLALLLVFLTAFGITQLTPPGVSAEEARKCQDLLRSQFSQVYKPNSPAGQQVLFEPDSQDPFLLRIRFQDRLLFDEDYAELKLGGEEVLNSLAQIIRQQLESIREIQIHGHADTRASKRFRSNLHLAAERANSVFQFLQLHGIDPAHHAISTTSYGEFFPVGRRPGEQWTWSRILEANSTIERRQLNRRVELLLFYGKQDQHCP